MVLLNATCIAAGHSNNDANPPQSIVCTRVELLFCDVQSADKGLSMIRSMQQGLRISQLQGCLWREQIMFSRSIGDTMIREYLLKDARLEVVLNAQTGHYRVIVSSACGSLSVCTECK